MNERILVIEDEIKTAHSIQEGLGEHHYQVSCAFDGALGLEMASVGNYQLIISDIILPNLAGVEMCRILRNRGINTPVLMLTALGTIDDKVIGFDAGADDYLVKPFEFKELLVRVRALLKRSAPNRETPHVLRFADLQLDADTKSVHRENETVQLTAREYALMEYFVVNAGRIISKTEIAEKVWSITFDTGTNVIEVYVNYLRNKVDKKSARKLIHTVHGQGYILKEE